MNERLFDLPDVDAARIEQRQSRLPGTVRVLIQQASDALVHHRPDLARSAMIAALARAPMQPDVLRMAGLVYSEEGDFAAARRYYELALQQGGDDALLYRQYAETLERAGAIEEAYELRKKAVELLPDSALVFFDLGEHCFQYEELEAAVAALEQAIKLAPGYVPALLKLGSALVYAGHVEEGAATYRQVLARHPDFGAAWFSLANIKTLPFAQSEIEQMQRMLREATVQDPDRLLIEFALAKAYEDAGSYQDAFSLLMDANERKRGQIHWSASRFSEQVKHSEQVFAAPHAVVGDPHFGSEAIFIVGLPRSGTTLTEQIIASHSRVEGANELGDLGRVLTEESARLRTPYPGWVAAATQQDWKRLGRRYLDLTARWRRRRPVFTDKMPSNWLFIGAIRAMLPGARIVVCRRDPLENCWSCFKQFFFAGWDFTFRLDDIASYWKDFDRTVSHWANRESGHIREHSYEALVAEPEVEIRGLLDFCGLPFEEACLHSHESSRSVRTASAGQVRQPLQKSVGRAPRYGELLDPLRRALGLTPVNGADDTPILGQK
ncbi:MAG: tetratricopeptide repeat-containing sulfotransferase family protein [Rhodanobacteraceae bacterium]